MEKGFFKVFNPKTSAKQLKIPTSFTDYKNGKLPWKVSLRDQFGNIWLIEVTKIEGNFYFQCGWEKVVEHNTLELGDFFIFYYDGKGTFDLKLLGRDGCEKKEVGGEKKEKKMNVEHQKAVELKGKNLASDSSNSCNNDSDEDYMVEEDDGEAYEVVVEEEEEKEEEEETEKAPRSRHRYVEKEEDEEEEENERAGTYKKTKSRSKAGCKRDIACTVRDRHDQFGAEYSKVGAQLSQKILLYSEVRSNKRYQVHAPIDVVRDYKLELPSSMTIRNSAGREFETKLKSWEDNRIWLIGRWRSLFGWNLVQNNDRCICEFVRGKDNEELF